MLARRSRFAVLVALTAAAGAGCVPHVSHGPRVAPGIRYFISSAVVRTQELQEEDVPLLPTMYLGGARGWVRSERGVAFSAGAQIPVYLLPLVVERNAFRTLLTTSYLDVYLQPRRAPPSGRDYGVGTLLSTGVAMPYLQVGRAGNGEFYTTQGFAFTYGDLNTASYWLPSVAHRSERPDGTRGVDVYLSAAVNSEHPTSEWFVSLGVVVDFVSKR